MKRQEKIKAFGFFNVNKPSGLVSSAVVNKCKWLTGVPCGHMGTLDPLACGVLPVGVGNAARLFDYFLQKDKEYVAKFTFGVTSDTLDSTGELVHGGRIPSEEEIIQVLPSLVGDVMQMPPKYSAKSVNGKRGYELARAGIDFELQAKKVRIDEINLLGQEDEQSFLFKIRCGGGTYIRSIARDMAETLDTHAVMSALQRTQSGVFTLENAVDFSVFEQDLSIDELEKYLIPTQAVLPYPSVCLEGKKAEKIVNGQILDVDVQDGLYKLFVNSRFYGIAQIEQGKAKAKTKLC